MGDWPTDHRGPGDKIMVVVAHPDDAEFMCAGTVAKWTQEGREVVYALVTSGDKGSPDPDIKPDELAKMRESEQRRVCDVLGVTTVEFLRYEDGMVQNTLGLREDIVRLIRRHRPDGLITQNPTTRWSDSYINHPDHRNTGDATLDAVFPSARDVHMFPDLLREEGLQPHVVKHLYVGARDDTANVFIDVSGTIDTKIRALKEHASQMQNVGDAFDDRIRQGSKKLGEPKGIPYAESFRYFYLGD
jgi:LmbE family N-acetylglucosaminyl deacetylase